MQRKSLSHTVKNISGKVRIVDYCGEVFKPLGSKSATKKAIKANRLYLNGKLAISADFVNPGDRITLKLDPDKIKQYNLPIDIVYEDEFFLIVDKPGGIAVNGNRFKTVENVFAKHLYNFNSADALPRPIAVHRLDVPTKGLLVLAKTKQAQIKLSMAFQQKKIEKSYLAVVHGKPPDEGQIDVAVEGKKALTKYKTLRTVPSKIYNHLSLVRLKPITGRTHQLRIHMKQLGHLIVGDKYYAGNQKTILGKGLFLQASSLSFLHPLTQKKLALKIDIPNRFNRVLDREEARFKI